MQSFFFFPFLFFFFFFSGVPRGPWVSVNDFKKKNT